MKTYLIYKYTSPSGKSYIGQTCDLKQRIKCHKSPNSKCRAFVSAIEKYGYESFTLEILEENLTLEEANILEELYIEQYITTSPHGYNLLSGGLNNKHSEETKLKLSIINSGNNHPQFGKHQSEENREHKSVASKGRSKSKEHCLNNSLSHIREKNVNWGKFGEDNKISKTYIVTFPDGHEEIVIGITNFCKINNLDNGHMIKVAKGKAKQHKGFKCRYAD